MVSVIVRVVRFRTRATATCSARSSRTLALRGCLAGTTLLGGLECREIGSSYSSWTTRAAASKGRHG